MPSITFTLSAAALTRVVDALKGLEPVPTDESGTPLFTDNGWAKEKVRRWIKAQVLRWEQFDAAETARDAIAEIDGVDLTVA